MVPALQFSDIKERTYESLEAQPPCLTASNEKDSLPFIYGDPCLGIVELEKHGEPTADSEGITGSRLATALLLHCPESLSA